MRSLEMASFPAECRQDSRRLEKVGKEGGRICTLGHLASARGQVGPGREK